MISYDDKLSATADTPNSRQSNTNYQELNAATFYWPSDYQENIQTCFIIRTILLMIKPSYNILTF